MQKILLCVHCSIAENSSFCAVLCTAFGSIAPLPLTLNSLLHCASALSLISVARADAHKRPSNSLPFSLPLSCCSQPAASRVRHGNSFRYPFPDCLRSEAPIPIAVWRIVSTSLIVSHSLCAAHACQESRPIVASG